MSRARLLWHDPGRRAEALALAYEARGMVSSGSGVLRRLTRMCIDVWLVRGGAAATRLSSPAPPASARE